MLNVDTRVFILKKVSGRNLCQMKRGSLSHLSSLSHHQKYWNNMRMKDFREDSISEDLLNVFFVLVIKFVLITRTSIHFRQQKSMFLKIKTLFNRKTLNIKKKHHSKE